MRASLLARIVVAVVGMFQLGTSQALVLLGDYSPTVQDIYVRADTFACCTGEYPGLTNVYLAQTFVATGTTPTSLTLGLVNELPSNVPPAPFGFRVLITKASGGFAPGAVLWESGDMAIAATSTGYAEYTFSLSGVALALGSSYAWILDTYSTRDGAADAGGWLGNIGQQAAPYVEGGLFLQSASGLGREADFGRTWINTGQDAAFLIQFGNTVPEPSSLALALLATALLLAAGSAVRPTTRPQATRPPQATSS